MFFGVKVFFSFLGVARASPAPVGRVRLTNQFYCKKKPVYIVGNHDSTRISTNATVLRNTEDDSAEEQKRTEEMEMKMFKHRTERREIQKVKL